jgi:hypothetical protein
MRTRGILKAGLIAAVVSGAPSTVHAVATGRDPLEATAAAGSLVLSGNRPRAALVLAGVPAHLTLSVWWALVITSLLPRRRRLLAGAVYGLAIAAVDLGVVGLRFPRIRRLPTGPQTADHVLFGMVVAAVDGSRQDKP